MGLDMYLNKRTYVGNKWAKPEEQLKIVPSDKSKTVRQERISEIVEEVGYWRKANAIHNWFIENCNHGEDDNCKDIYVTEEQLKELRTVCEEVVAGSELVEGKIADGYSFDKEGKKVYNMVDGKYIKNPAVARKLLPTTEGFFFGSTDYDEYYLQDIKDTIVIIDKALEDGGGGDFYYHASW